MRGLLIRVASLPHNFRQVLARPLHWRSEIPENTPIPTSKGNSNQLPAPGCPLSRALFFVM
jgi:hypothetical protein